VTGADGSTPEEAGRATRRRRGTSRRTRQDPATARAQLLGAGLELAAEHSLGETLGHLRINDLARDAGLTSGAFYHYWDGQDAYRAEVLDALLAGERADADPALYEPDDDAAGGPARIVDGVARRVLDRLVEDPDHRLELALWAHRDPRALDRIRQRAEGADTAVATMLADHLHRIDRRPALGWDLGRLATVAVALTDGLRSQHLIDPTAASDRGDAWSAPGLLGLLLLVGATEEGGRAAPPGTTAPAPSVPTEVQPRRQRLVDLGIQAARARPTGNAFDHIRADDVARRVGLTIGAFYHYWDSQEDYRDDLVDALFAADRYVDPTGMAAQGLALADADELDGALRDITSWYWSIASSRPDSRVQFAFYTLDDPYITGRLSAWDQALRDAWHTAMDTLLARFGRRWREPLSTDLVVLGLSSLLDGLVVRHGLEPAGLGPDDDDGWTLWGRAGRAFILAGSSTEALPTDFPTMADEALAG